MHKQLLFDLKLEDGVFKNNNTGEILGNTLKLYCFKSDENNIYLDTPKIDYPDNYTIVKNDGTEISLRQKFEDEGKYKKYYAIVSKHTKITSIEPFFIEECNAFYSIEIKRDVKDLIEAIGFDNLFVDEKLFGNYLINHTKNSNGYELVFFIHSKNGYYEKLLNEFKLKLVKINIDRFCELYIQNGLHLLIREKESSTIKDIKGTIKNKVELFKNGRKYELNMLLNNEDLLKAYSDLLYDRVKTLISKYPYNTTNFLYFGYTDEWITEELKKRYGIL